MSFNVKSTGLLTVSVALMATLSACGAKSSKDTTTATASITQLVSDSSLQSSVVNASHGDAVSATVDQASSGAALALSGGSDSGSESGKSSSTGEKKDGDDDSKSTVDRSCAVSGNSAVVTISSNVNRTETNTRKNGTVSVERSRTGSGTMTRTWSKTDGTAVTCRADGGASVDFHSPDGLKLDVDFTRSRVDSQKMTNSKTGTVTSSSKSFSASGKRSITWTSNATADGATTFVRHKSITITNDKHDMTMTAKDGTSLSSSLTINTTEGKPLVVDVERNVTGHDVVSKTIVSGEVVTKKDADAVITTTYENLKLQECKAVSGKATIVIADAAGVVQKTLVLDASSGDAVLSDKDSGSEVEDFVLDDCDSEDLKI